MKRTILLILIIFGLTVPAFTQEGRRDWNRLNIPRFEEVTVSGSLIVAHGMPALSSGGITYLILGLNRLVGFVDGLVEGAYVTISGHAMSSPRDDNLRILRPTELIFSERTYDLTLPGGQFLPDLRLRDLPLPERGRLNPRENPRVNPLGRRGVS